MELYYIYEIWNYIIYMELDFKIFYETLVQCN